MVDLLLDLINYIKDQGIISGDGIDAFRDKSPASPDECFYMLEYRGRPQGIGNFGIRWVQFNYRAASYSVAKKKCTDIFKLFGIVDEDQRIQINADRWLILHCIGSPFKSAVDEQGRTIFTFNARIFTYYE